jgi:hypothetical protein
MSDAPDLSSIVRRVGAMFERAYAIDATRPTSKEVETILRDGYACALELERERSQIERKTAMLIAAAADSDQLTELRLLGARHAELDRNIRWLRSLLLELREYRAGLQPSQ